MYRGPVRVASGDVKTHVRFPVYTGFEVETSEAV
jgi:hypothetical protein